MNLKSSLGFSPLLYFIFCSSFFTTKLIILLKDCYRLPREIPKTSESKRRLSSLILCPCSIGCTEFLFLHLKDVNFTSGSQEHSSVLRQRNPLCLRYVRYNQPQEALKGNTKTFWSLFKKRVIRTDTLIRLALLSVV